MEGRDVVPVKKKRRRKKVVFPLKEVLARYGWSQNRLAKASGITFAGVNKIACGRNFPSWETVVRIATTIGADLGDFVPGKGGAA